MKLSDNIAADAASSRGAPASSPVTRPAGRPPTGSRTSCCATGGPDVYDQWVTHDDPVQRPRRSSTAAETGPAAILKNPKYVNGGYGDVKTIATTSFQEGGLPITDRQVRHAPAGVTSTPTSGPKGTKVAEDGDVFAFYLPAVDPAKGKPVLVARRVRRRVLRPRRGRRPCRPTSPPPSGPTAKAEAR